MKIIISPAKNMKEEVIGVGEITTPMFLDDALLIWDFLKHADNDILKKAWECNDDIVAKNKLRLEKHDLKSNLMPCLLVYDGLQYKKMGANVFNDDMWNYVNKHLRILSGIYGLLRPMDGINPYRIMMGANIKVNGTKNLYDYWGNRIYDALVKDDNVILNLASKEYSDVIEPFIKDDVIMYTVNFMCMNKGKLVIKGTEAKACRGLMVQYLARNNVEDIEGVKGFDEMDYKFNKELSIDDKLVFVKQ